MVSMGHWWPGVPCASGFTSRRNLVFVYAMVRRPVKRNLSFYFFSLSFNFALCIIGSVHFIRTEPFETIKQEHSVTRTEGSLWKATSRGFLWSSSGRRLRCEAKFFTTVLLCSHTAEGAGWGGSREPISRGGCSLGASQQLKSPVVDQHKRRGFKKKIIKK